MPHVQPTYYTLDELTPQLPEIAKVLEYWKSLRDGAKVPRWDAFDPLAIYEQMPGCMILKILEEDNYHVQFFGTGLVSRFGFDLTGSNGLDLYPGEERKKVKDRTQIALERPAIILSTFAGNTGNGLPMRSESLVAPLTNEKMEIEYLLYPISQLEFDPYDPIELKSIHAADILNYGYFDL